MPVFHLTAPELTETTRIDSWLQQQLVDYSRAQIQRWLREGYVHVNGAAVKAKYQLRANDTIAIEVPDRADPMNIVAEDLPLNVLHEDEDIIVVNKAAGMIVHPGAGQYSGTLVNALLHHCDDLSGIGGVERPGIVHRLDQGTSGVMIVAKHDASHQHLSAQFAERRVQKMYLALCYGEPGETGTIDAPIGRHPSERKKMSTNSRNGKAAVTHWEHIESFGGHFSKLRVRIETGRTHQIRVHLTARGYPLLGDKVYGGPKQLRRLEDPLRSQVEQLLRPALHAAELSCMHPRTGEMCTWKAAWPEDLQSLCDDARRLLA